MTPLADALQKIARGVATPIEQPPVDQAVDAASWQAASVQIAVGTTAEAEVFIAGGQGQAWPEPAVHSALNVVAVGADDIASAPMPVAKVQNFSQHSVEQPEPALDQPLAVAPVEPRGETLEGQSEPAKLYGARAAEAETVRAETVRIEPFVRPVFVPPSASGVQLYCDLTGDDQLAYLTAAQACDLVIHVDGPPLASGAPLLDECGDDLLLSLRWPRGLTPLVLPGQAGTRVQLQRGTSPLAPREWVLFLEDCRDSYLSTGVILPATAGRELDWLASRCDLSHLITRNAQTDAAEARRMAIRLGRHTRLPPTCLLVKAA